MGNDTSTPYSTGSSFPLLLPLGEESVSLSLAVLHSPALVVANDPSKHRNTSKLVSETADIAVGDDGEKWFYYEPERRYYVNDLLVGFSLLAAVLLLELAL